MMNNLFTMFDPSSNILNLNWLSIFLPLIFLMKKYWITPSKIDTIFAVLNNMSTKDLKNNMKKILYKNLFLFNTTLSTIYILNLSSILPFIFAPSSHISLSLSLSMPMWMALMMMGWINNFEKMITHMVPSNTPNFLCPFMVLIETISILIRPMTLAIRLSANIIAGHILISLLSKTLNMTMLVYPMIIPMINLLTILELSVALIQSYVFIILMSLYLNEM